MSMEKQEPRYCRVCGKKLVSHYYFRGYCASHYAPSDRKLVEDARKAKELGLSYGKYMALKKEGLVQ